MPVGGHRDQIDLLTLRRRRDFLGRIPRREHRVRFDSRPLHFLTHPLEIRAVLFQLLGLAQVERSHVARRPAVGDVQQQQLGAQELREAGDVIEDRPVGRAVLERHQDAFVHQRIQPAKMRTSSQPLNAAIATATTYESAVSHFGFTNSPILSRSDVNRTSGKTANESCRLRITWLRIRSWAVPCSPKKIAVAAAGTIAMSRVMRRRNQGRMRILRNPSITIWPASVPVSVEFCPDASSANANTALAPVTPSSGVSSR